MKKRLTQEEKTKRFVKKAKEIKMIRASIRDGFGLPEASIIERGVQVGKAIKEKMKTQPILSKIKRPQQTPDKGTQQIPNLGIKERLQGFGNFRIFDRFQQPQAPQLTDEERRIVEERKLQADEEALRQAEEREKAKKAQEEHERLEKLRGNFSVQV